MTIGSLKSGAAVVGPQFEDAFKIKIETMSSGPLRPQILWIIFDFDVYIIYSFF